MDDGAAGYGRQGCDDRRAAGADRDADSGERSARGADRRTRVEAGSASEDAEQFERTAVEGAEGVGIVQTQAEVQTACGVAPRASSSSNAASSGFRLLLPRLRRGRARRGAKPMRDL